MEGKNVEESFDKIARKLLKNALATVDTTVL